jgi:hypothetical protein
MGRQRQKVMPGIKITDTQREDRKLVSDFKKHKKNNSNSLFSNSRLISEQQQNRDRLRTEPGGSLSHPKRKLAGRGGPTKAVNGDKATGHGGQGEVLNPNPASPTYTDRAAGIASFSTLLSGKPRIPEQPG